MLPKAPSIFHTLLFLPSLPLLLLLVGIVSVDAFAIYADANTTAAAAVVSILQFAAIFISHSIRNQVSKLNSNDTEKKTREKPTPTNTR